MSTTPSPGNRPAYQWVLERLMWRLRRWCDFHLGLVWVTDIAARAKTEPHLLNPDIAHRRVGLDEALSAGADPDLKLDPGELRARFARGDELFGSFDGRRLVGYSWYTRKPTRVSGNVVVTFPRAFTYGYDGRTIPPYRGRGISSDKSQVTTRVHVAEGRRYHFRYKDIENYASLRSGLKLKHKERVGFYVYFRASGRYFVYTSPGCRRLGIVFAASPVGRTEGAAGAVSAKF